MLYEVRHLDLCSVHGQYIFSGNDNAETLAVKIHDEKGPTRYIVTSIYASCTTLARRYRSTRSCTYALTL